MENTLSPVKKEDLTAKANLEELVNNEYVETTDNTPTISHIKEEDQDTKELLNGLHPVTNGMQATEEIVDNDNKFVTTSVITFFSPIIEVESQAGTDHVTKSNDSVIDETGTPLSCEELLHLVTSFHEPAITQEKWGYCGMMVRNLMVHIRLNHKKKSMGFTGFSSLQKSVDRKRTSQQLPKEGSKVPRISVVI